jgi:hypothetical protein
MQELSKQPTFEDKLEQVFKFLDLSADCFGNVTLKHKQTGSSITFATNGDIQLKAARDIDQKSNRWIHFNSDVGIIEQNNG